MKKDLIMHENKINANVVFDSIKELVNESRNV